MSLHKVVVSKMKASIILISLTAATLLLWRNGGMKKSLLFASVVEASPKFSNPEFSSPYDPIANATLGFQEVAVISLESRPDRRKAIVDAARATNLSLTILNGIIDEEVLPQYLPKNWDSMEHWPGQLGAYFSHMRALDRIIDKKISTALILESDADWDMRIREILPNVAKGVKRLMDYPFSENDDDQVSSSQSGPYGDHWDVLWLGHCGCLGPYDGRIYSFNDLTAPPKWAEFSRVATDPSRPYVRPDNLRIVHQIEDIMCTYAYAVTLEGARKLREAGQESWLPWDNRLRDICIGDRSIRCATVTPQIFGAAYSKTTMGYADETETPPPEANPDNEGKGPTPGLAIQISARRNSHLPWGVSPASWIREWSSTDV